jgi:hypothetical protein
METILEPPQLEPVVEVGHVISCPHCLGRHVLRPGPNNGSLLLYYKCGRDLRLGAVAGKLVVGAS